MKYALSISAALLLAVTQLQPAAAQTNQLVDEAVKALGGADAMRGLKAVSITGEAKYWEPGQAKVAGGEPKHVEDVTFTIIRDLAGSMARTQWDRDHKYPDPAARMKYIEVTTPTGGFVTDDKDASTAMSGVRVAAALRELARSSPTLLLKAVDNQKDVRAVGNQQIGRQSYRAVSLKDGATTFIIMFDAKTHLPAAVRTLDDDNVQGDSNYDAVLSDWKAVAGVQVPHSLSYQINGIEVAKVTYKQVTANPTITADTFAAPDTVKSALKGPATGNVPYQWVIRRLYMSRLADNDPPFLPQPGGSLKLVELAPNVQHVQGGGANNLVVAMKDHLVVFDAPYGEAQSRVVIDLAKAKYPGKPIKYVVMTHHHMDHSGGLRTYVAEGATIVVAAPTKAYFDKALRRPRTIANDAQQTARKPLRITEVKDQLTLKDEVGEIRIYNIKNPHADGYLLGHVIKENVVFVTDLISPRGPIARTEGSLAVGEAFKKYGIKDALIAGGHGTTAKQSEIGQALGMEVSVR